MVVALGIIAGALTTFAGLPQLIRGFRTRSTDDLSLAAIAMFTVGVGLWIAYGAFIHSLPLVAWNSVTMAIYVCLLGLRIVHLRSRSTGGNGARSRAVPPEAPPT
jgi:MtN3 and saliva related transmembrane protein